MADYPSFSTRGRCRGGRPGLVSASAPAFAATAGYADPIFTFTFRNLATGAVDYRFSSPIVEANAVRAHRTGLIALGQRRGIRAVHRGNVLEITLQYENGQGVITPVATLSLSLNRHGLRGS